MYESHDVTVYIQSHTKNKESTVLIINKAVTASIIFHDCVYCRAWSLGRVHQREGRVKKATLVHPKWQITYIHSHRTSIIIPVLLTLSTMQQVNALSLSLLSPLVFVFIFLTVDASIDFMYDAECPY